MRHATGQLTDRFQLGHLLQSFFQLGAFRQSPVALGHVGQAHDLPSGGQARAMDLQVMALEMHFVPVLAFDQQSRRPGKFIAFRTMTGKALGRAIGILHLAQGIFGIDPVIGQLQSGQGFGVSSVRKSKAPPGWLRPVQTLFHHHPNDAVARGRKKLCRSVAIHERFPRRASPEARRSAPHSSCRSRLGISRHRRSPRQIRLANLAL